MIKPRPDYQAKLEKHKVFYGDENALQWGWCEFDTYWNEEGKVEISDSAEAQLMEASFTVHNMALEAVDKIVSDDVLLSLFYVSPDLWPAVRESWNKGKTDFQGRFDFAWDGKNPPKLLEYNADTPSLQLESSVLSDEWFKDKQKDYEGHHQANYMQAAFMQAFGLIMDYCKTNLLVNIQDDIAKYGGRYLRDIGITVIPEDEENTAVMLYFYDIIQKFTKSLDLLTVSDLHFVYGYSSTDPTKTENYWNNLAK